MLINNKLINENVRDRQESTKQINKLKLVASSSKTHWLENISCKLKQFKGFSIALLKQIKLNGFS